MQEGSMGCGISSQDKTRNKTQLVDCIGSPGWTRTNDQRINSPTLYQLSYRGVDGAPRTVAPGWALRGGEFLRFEVNSSRTCVRGRGQCSQPRPRDIGSFKRF